MYSRATVETSVLDAAFALSIAASMVAFWSLWTLNDIVVTVFASVWSVRAGFFFEFLTVSIRVSVFCSLAICTQLSTFSCVTTLAITWSLVQPSELTFDHGMPLFERLL